MKSKTNEQALEAAIEKKLTGTSSEELNASDYSSAAEHNEHYRTGNGYYIGDANDFNKDFAIDEVRFWDFLAKTQDEELAKIQRSNDWKRIILERLDRLIKKYGIIYVLKKGLAIDDAHFTLFYELPLASSSKATIDKFESNQFSTSRQIRYSKDNPRQEIDMVLFLNGLPLVTLELKNHWTGQNARVHGQNQYCNDRDISQPLLNFARCIVHFAVDTDEAFMTTKLDGRNTFFLPFNKGFNDGKGNPPNPFGHKTNYLWEEVFTRESLANIIQHFVRLDGKAKDALKTKTLFFPRYHQLNVVRNIVKHASENGLGQNYLIQHSAGSGKSNSITWAAYQLIETYPLSADLPGSKGIDNPLFDSVIVVTDRRLLDKQIRENIKSFSEVKNIVSPAYSSKELRESIEQGKKIIITTIQKFPFIVEGIADMSDKRFAVIIDEAHSSQGGTSADKMNEAMGNSKSENDDDEIDVQDLIMNAMKARKMRDNASYLAFTATPKNITLNKFGTEQEDGSFRPFDLYSMKQAIEEGFILDVLANYTTYKSYYEIEKSIADNPEFDTKKAQKKLRAYVEQEQSTINTKAEIMLEHFVSQVYNKKKLKGQAKAMIVTQSIISAMKYYKAINEILDKKGNPFKTIVAFSGKKTLNGIEHTEDSLNNLPSDIDTAKPTEPGYISDKIARYFDMPDYKILIVANKYLTGFDQPKLCTMYVDKKLQGVLAVQALSRLNRSANKLGKKTEDIFVLDFFNKTEEIEQSFDPFYTATSLNRTTDVNVLHELKEILEELGVYEWSEVETFNEKYFQGEDAEKLSILIDIAAARFNNTLNLEKEEKADFKIKAKQFVKIYGQMASILPYEKIEWEKSFWFLKFLIPKLIIIDPQADLLDELLNSVDLSTYGLERTKLNEHIELDDEETKIDPQNPNPRGAHGGDTEEEQLEQIISSFNEKWFKDWSSTPEEKRVKMISLKKNIIEHKDFEPKVANNPDEQNKDIALKKIMDEILRKQRKIDLELYKLSAQDSAFYQSLFDTMKRVTITR